MFQLTPEYKTSETLHLVPKNIFLSLDTLYLAIITPQYSIYECVTFTTTTNDIDYVTTDEISGKIGVDEFYFLAISHFCGKLSRGIKPHL